MPKIAIILVRGTTGMRRDIKYALHQLKLTRKNHCVLYGEAPKGLMIKIKDYVTWGEIDAATEKALTAKGDAPYALHPPVGGFRGGIKKPYPKGALGNRGEKINALIKSMLQ
ncbi:50S ribosomal protein L30 [Candidatus Norongarragalina meridionalis]|nr:50S ribosomal protein L30 [Candidatus Norongarragalina meridionalis]